MIKEYLSYRYKCGKLYNSWLISADKTASALKEVQEFISQALFEGDSVENHPDHKIIEKLETTSKSISIEQLREMQEFLSKTPIKARYKVAIIYHADLMTLNAANSCLKILEDTPSNSYIFLITSKALAILPTIRSRCAKVSFYLATPFEESRDYIRFITPLLASNCQAQERLEILNQLASKDREIWNSFVDSILMLLTKIIKKYCGINSSFNELEDRIVKQLHSTEIEYLLKKFENIRKLADNTIDYDLELRASYLLLIDQFSR